MIAESIDDIYELSPMQRGMLFHTVYTPHSGVYIEQAIYHLRGALRTDLLRQAWQSIQQRHAVLRTLFVWEGLDEPVQVVQQTADLPWQELDWRGNSSVTQQGYLDELLSADRQRGFEMNQAPLLRIALLRIAHQEYYLLVTYHHLLLDGWSLAETLREVLVTYEAYVRGSEPVLSARRPYHDYLLWLQQQDLGAAEAFWRRYLKGFVAPTPLSLESAGELPEQATGVAPQLSDEDKAEQTSALPRLHLSGGRSVTLQGRALSTEKTTALRQFARQHRLTVNTLIQGAWSLLLSRYSGQDDIVFGATVNGRPLSLPGAEDMIGLFINTLPVRAQIPAREALLTWLTRLQMQQAETRQYDYSPLVQIQGWSDVPREQPLFESLMVFENYPLNTEEDQEAAQTLDVSAVQMLEQTNYPLVLAVGAWRRLELHIGYSTTQFAAPMIARMLEHLCMLLDAFLTYPERQLQDFSLLTEHEKQSLLVSWNQTAEDYPAYRNWSELFSRQAQATPEEVALTYGAETYSYRVLEQRANQLALYLRQRGSGPEARIAVCLERSPDLCISLLSCLQAGAIYLPVDPHYPPERIAFLLADAQVELLITRSEFLAACGYPSERAVLLDSEQAAIAQQCMEPLDTLTYPDNGAYLIYTSGSTGAPKGVIGTHRSLINHSQACVQRYNLRSSDRVLQFASLNFDVFLEECLPSWSIGATVVMWPEAYPPAPAAFNRYLEQEHLTVINIPSSYWHAWVAEMTHAHSCPPQILRAVVIGSERALPAQLQNWFLCADERIALYNAYGLTETTITALTYQASGRPANPIGQRVPVGRPLGNVQAYILDTEGRPAAIGLPGELYIGGLALARGYLDRPELTAERFVPHLFSQQPGERLYRTGDQARYLPGGEIEVMGRLDAQIKLRGFRIEPGEIESVLTQDPAVQECVVVMREDTPGESRLVAYVVARTSSQALVARLQQRAQEKLPPYMLPAICLLSDKLPRTSTGKIDPRQLPAPEQQSSANKKNYVAPETPLEEILASIWTSVLQVEGIGRSDHFFRLGGHSLQATQVVARLRDILQLELPVRAIYDQPTIAKLAKHIEALRKPEQSVSIPALKPMERGEDVPLSFAQERFWFLNQWQPDNPFYNISLALQLHGPLSLVALEQAWNIVVARHEPLRTTILSRDGVGSQHIHGYVPVAVPMVDLADMAVPARQLEVRRRLAEEAQRPFQLDQTLVRITLFRIDEQEHVLLLMFHHIIVDGWSIDIVLQELQTFYRSQQEGQERVEPEPLPLQYADYALWQRGWLQGSVLETQLSYWKQRLAGAPPTLDLPTDRPRPAVQTFQGALYPFRLTPALGQELQDLNREEGVTNFMALLAGFYLVFARYTGQYDIVVGTPTAGRLQRETEQMVGLFLNTLPLRICGDAVLTWRELLAMVRDVALDAYSHQDLPFEKLVEALQPERSQSHSPLFQVLFVYQNTPRKELSWPGLQAELIEIGNRTAKQDLTIELREAPEGLRGVVEYNVDLFDEQTIARMITHFQGLLESAMAAPDLPIGELPLLTAAERRQILSEWNATVHDTIPDLCLHTLFERQASRTPGAIAVLTEGGQLTYQELDERANQLAHYLHARGIGAEQRIGVCLERTPQMIVSLLAILKSGAAYVPLDVRFPAGRIRFCVEDAGIQLVLTQSSLLQQLELVEGLVLCLDELGERLSGQPKTKLPSRVSAANLAYLIYTSGSTGTPKAVAITHQSPVVLVRWAQHVFAPEDLAGVLAATSITFDLSIFEIFVPLSSGGTVILAKDILHLPTLEVAQQVTLINTVPSAAAELARLQAIPASVRAINLAGEPLTLPLVQELYQHTAAQRIFNLYGPSEDTTYSTFALQARDATANPAIGRPIAHTRVYLLDASQQPVPVGVIGELYLGGNGLARGYLHRPDLTAEKFVPDPFSEEPGMRLYRTGDLARYRPNGELEFIGRNDHQVKVRGYRIELGEIEQALFQHPHIQQCAVIVREDTPDDRVLVAYCELKADASSSLSSEFELRHFLRARLPEYMLPTRIELLDALPLNTNGKVDRRALPAPVERQSIAVEAALNNPALSQVEELLLGIWSPLLQREAIGLHDNFFELGGHSLMAIRIIARMREVFHLDIKLRLLFEAPTIAELAQHIEAMLQESNLEQNALPVLQVQERPAIIPLSFAQERLWFLSQLEPTSPAYTLPFALKLSGSLQVERLEQCLNALIQRHESLRTSLVMLDDTLQQVITPELVISLPQVQVIAGTAEAQEQEVQTLIMDEALTPFDFTQPSLLRVKLLKIAADEHILLLTLHHCIADAWSIGILVNELSQLYSASLLDEEGQLPALPIQYADYALWQRQWLQGAVLEQQIRYWRSALQGAPELLALPLDYARPAIQKQEGRAHTLRIPAELTAQLQELSVRAGATLFMTLLSAFQVLLLRYTGQDDMVIGTPVAGRTQSETEGLIGCFINTLPLRTRLSGDPTFRELLMRVRESCLEGFRHQELPFERIVDAIQPKRSLSHHPLFQVMFILQNAPQGDLNLPGLEMESLAIGNPTTKFDLTLALTELPGEGMSALFEYNLHLFEASTIIDLAQHFMVLLQELVHDPEKRVLSYELMSDEERQRLLSITRGAEVATYRTDTLLYRIAQQAATTPQASAVVAGERTLTYAELEAQSNQLARLLRLHGVVNEARVGICLDRSIELSLALLGVLKAGGAYVPLDPRSPLERLAFQMRDAQIELLLTQSQWLARLDALSCQSLCLDEPERHWQSMDSTALDEAILPAQLAYIIYTSGSTGTPKGVLVTHEGMYNYLAWAVDTYPMSEGCGAPVYSAINFDLTVSSLFAPLLSGQSVVMLPEKQAEAQSIEALQAAFTTGQRWSLIKLTPAHLSALSHLLLEEQVARSSKALIIGGRR
ncbi:hypothetical protein KDH_23850 [Dictyobacter sp. S3.2.2.5]|uniref:Carrier domain-containing protein n=1 Tax=Dictyobacter halimunensis TaxID=3026934 RepID=A0ABQ6FSV7_9CHLR|nr:hypothetical protein KDH_23850 [Dictyobacter sp. S3.2.2.5]